MRNHKFGIVALLALALGTPFAAAQPVRITKRIDKTRRTSIACCLAPAARPELDMGAAAEDFAVDGLTLYTRPTAEQQAELERLLAEQQDPKSANYRRFLTPEQYADRFGLNAGDVAKLVEWLRDEGFTVKGSSRGRNWIAFSGAAGRLRSAFGANIRRYRVDGQMHYANSGRLTVPEALAGTVAGVEGLDDLEPGPTPIVAPEMNGTAGRHYLAPDDIATIYNINAAYKAGLDGAGQKVAVVGTSAVDVADITAFRTKFNLPAMDLQTVLVPNYPNPGINKGSLPEADLDIEWSGAVARKATIIYVYSTSALTAVRHVIDQKLAPVVSRSFSVVCEKDYIPEYYGSVLQYQTLAQQAAVQGITWVNSSGDSGAAGCDVNSSSIAQNGLGVRFPQSVPEVTAVGGTQFNEGSGSYWAAANDANSASALSYIPETVWNDASAGHGILAGGGGVSAVFRKPSWQTGPGVPDDGMRDIPDISMSSSVYHVPYYVATGGSAGYYGGTSVATPIFAGVVALLNQFLTAAGALQQPGLGNLNPTLYKLAQTAPNVFHDVVTGDNKVPCSAGSPDCVGGWVGYNAGPGYDLATGLGSPDVGNLLLNWPNKPASEALVVVTITPNPVYQQKADSSGNQWFYTITLTEEAGVAATLSSLTIDGSPVSAASLTSWFGSLSIPARGSLTVSLGVGALQVPRTRVYKFTGTDASGRAWSQEIPVLFNPAVTAPTVAGVSNAASGQLVYAPGMIMSVYGSQMAAAPQAAGAVPLLTIMQHSSATINGVLAPLYFVSPNQVNVQIPYETKAGAATLIIDNGQSSVAYGFSVAAVAPGVFVDSAGAPVPYAQGRRGDVLILFITGQGQVSPAIATGAAPAATSVSQLPVPQQAVKLSIGGADAKILFAGIPNGLVGVTQINFQVPDGAPLGLQKLVVTVGDVGSAPVNFTVTP
ncbi:MAG: S8 family serine peptidase [Acidobacteria bacterium]|nr:S8 family serine peptidase [Acidobacteriota bacterium]